MKTNTATMRSYALMNQDEKRTPVWSIRIIFHNCQTADGVKHLIQTKVVDYSSTPPPKTRENRKKNV